MIDEEYINRIGKIMKPYWESRFGPAKLSTCCEPSGLWYGFEINGKTIIGCHPDELEDGVWFYDGNVFTGAHDLFGLDKHSFKIAMRKYLNETYNLNLKQVI